jgi:hypothetical protein
LADRFTGEDIQRVKLGSLELERVKVQVDLVEKRQDVQQSDIEAIRVALRVGSQSMSSVLSRAE